MELTNLTQSGAASWMSILAGIGIALTALEQLWARSLYSDSGMLSWDVQRLQRALPANPAIRRARDQIMQFRSFVAGCVLRLAGAVGMIIVRPDTGVYLVFCLAVLAGLAQATMRSPFGHDGAHQVYVLVTVALVIYALVDNGSRAQRLVLYFIAAQASLSYAVSGIAKLVSEPWRNGDALRGILDCWMYGNRGLVRVLDRVPKSFVSLSWVVIVFEALFALWLIAPIPIVVGLLVVGVLFHLSNALVMGLNGFFFAFLAMYPTILFVAQSY